jgi:hypothetical protein
MSRTRTRTKPFTIDDMRRFALEAWGPLGAAVVTRWQTFNKCYFGGKLKPVPLVITHTQPFGKRIAFCSYAPGAGRTITLNVPKHHDVLLADNCTLLHEMIHQALFEQDEAAGHDSEGWRREIMRLHRRITGADIWAGKSQAVRQGKEVVRINLPHPQTGAPSWTQKQIARWPHDTTIALGRLGES